MAYFDEFPDILLPSFVDGRTSSSDFVRSKNLFKRAKIRDDFFSVATVFDFYTINRHFHITLHRLKNNKVIYSFF